MFKFQLEKYPVDRALCLRGAKSGANYTQSSATHAQINNNHATLFKTK
jgi:hypothetical protein